MQIQQSQKAFNGCGLGIVIHSILRAPILAKVDDNALVSFSIQNSAHPIPRHMQLDWN